jgi:hypothetical protein
MPADFLLSSMIRIVLTIVPKHVEMPLLVESVIGIHHMKAGKPRSGYWATPAPGLKTEFEADSVEEGFMSSPSASIPSGHRSRITPTPHKILKQ